MFESKAVLRKKDHEILLINDNSFLYGVLVVLRVIKADITSIESRTKYTWLRERTQKEKRYADNVRACFYIGNGSRFRVFYTQTG